MILLFYIRKSWLFTEYENKKHYIHGSIWEKKIFQIPSWLFKINNKKDETTVLYRNMVILI
jgi:hypothetical protein